ncbi:MAG: RNA polymerase sigma factor region1.1 domain-containing protein, partial [Oscillochloridaceae bacterium]|nr:RNA polymerase sigma factor region1.1 domain-containing protein [Oscillochloridaceae bacterium]
PELTPFSLEELGLSPEEIAQLEAAAQAAAPSAPEPPPAEPELTPFSLEELGLSPEEIAQLEAARTGAAGEREASPSSRNQQENLSRGSSTFGAVAETPTAAENDLGEITPFSLEEFDLDAPNFEPGEGELPPSLRPFSIDEPPATTTPPPAEEEAEPKAAYSWQQPAAKSQPGFASRQEEETHGQESIFDRLKARAAALPLQEPEPLRPIADEELAQSDYFSHDDVSLREDEPAGQNRFVGGFRLPKEDVPISEASPAPGATERVKEPPPAEPELTPFSLEELGLSPEEIAQLEAAAQAAAPSAPEPPPAEPELTPFSLEELGLSPEEIAQLEAAARGELPSPATGDTIVPGWSRGEEPELQPFAPDELSINAAASGAELDLSGLKPFAPEDFGATVQPSAPDEALPEDIEPFSFEDLDLGDIESFDGQTASRELGLSAEELEGLDLGQFETILNEHYDTHATPSNQGDAALERLMSLGRRQGYVDLTDIIAVVSDPEAEADRIEAIGWALHRAGIQIRDGDEIIDMEEVEAEGESEAVAPTAEAELTPFSLEELGLSPEEIAALGLTEATAEAAPAAPPAEPELTPFSLEELGLSPEEIAQLEAARAAAEAAPAAPPAEPELTPFSLEELGLSPEEIAQLEAARAAAEAAPAAPPAEPELTPFSLEELGLSPEEIAQLEAARAAAEAAPAAPPATEEEADLFDFDLAGAPPVEKVTRRTAPRVEEPPPALDPADAAFQPEPLDSLDDIWQTPLPAPPTPSVAREEPPREAPARGEPIASSVAAPAPPARSSAAPTPRREGERLISRGRDEERFARREAARVREPGSRRGRATLTMRLSDLTPTGDATLDEYLRQLEGDPENSGLALAIGRLCAQTSRAEVMVMAYRSLIRAGRDLDLLTEELESLIDVISDGDVQRQIFRLLGDAYAKQGRSRDAIAAYGQVFTR